MCVFFVVRVGQPCRVARQVMERSPHSFLVGEGAEAFAQEQGFTIEPNNNMLSDQTATAYQVLTHCQLQCQQILRLGTEPNAVHQYKGQYYNHFILSFLFI